MKGSLGHNWYLNQVLAPKLLRAAVLLLEERGPDGPVSLRVFAVHTDAELEPTPRAACARAGITPP